MFQPTGFSEKIFKDRYAFTEDETWEQACRRVSRQMSIAETPDKQKQYEDKFFEVLSDNKFVPGGRIWYNSGRANPQMLNCFVLANELDSKEGWGNISKEMIITSMTGGGSGICFSDVRPKGSTIASQRGDCPGPVSLMELLDGNAKPVKAGGQRRVALMFSLDLAHPDILEFLDAKLTKGKLTHANVSVQCNNVDKFVDAVKNDGDWELSWKGKYKSKIKARFLWDKIVKNAYESAEPGFLNWDLVESENNISYFSKLHSTNPCQPEYATVLTKEGIRTLGEMSIGDEIWSGKRWTKITNKWSNGIKPVNCYTTTTGYFLGTENHKIVQNEEKIEVKNAKSIDWCLGEPSVVSNLDPNDIIDGLVLGDGGVHRASGNLVGLYIGTKDQDYFTSEISSLIKKHRPGISKTFYEIKTTIDYLEVPKTYDRYVPSRFLYGDSRKKCGFLRGLFTANGSITGGRVSLKQTSKLLITQVQEMLSSLGIHSYITTNKPKMNTFSNGQYLMKESYDLNITSGRTVFKNNIGFIQKYKNNNIIEGSKPTYLTSNIKKVEYIEDCEVFDITVDDPAHTYWSGGCLVSNCGEQPLNSYSSCCLGHTVLSRFVTDGEFDWHDFATTIRTAVRFLDNVLSVNHFPLKEMKDMSDKIRRIGLGTTAVADALVLLNLKYGSIEANKFVDKLGRFLSKTAYEASVMLAIEKGMFPACQPDKHIESGYMKRMPLKIKSLVKEHGIRNCAILTIAPTGTVSILSDNCSSGIEPMFAPAYERRYWEKDERKTELVFHPLFKKFMDEGKDVSSFVSARDLSVKEHLEVQRIIQTHIDSAVSKTINIPENYSIEDMSEIWLEYLPKLKGTTFYRENSRGYYNEATGITEPPPLTALSLDEAKKRYTKDAIIGKDDNDCSKGTCDI